MAKLSEVAHKTLDNYDQIREPIGSYATMLTCLIEFDWIEQSLQSETQADSKLKASNDGSLTVAKPSVHTRQTRRGSSDSPPPKHANITATPVTNMSPLGKPNRVSHRDCLMTRQQLLLMRSTLLEKCEEIMSQTHWPFAASNLSTEKIFHDLRQYHNNPGSPSILMA